MSTNILKMIVYAGLPLLAWGGDENFVAVEDALGLQPNAPVVWSAGNAREYVGKVSRVIANDKGGSTIYFYFHKEFEKIIREDVTACAWLDKRVREAPFLLLVGGTNSNKLGITVLLVVLVFAVLAFLFVKTVWKLAKYLLVIGGVVVIVYFGSRLLFDWKSYHACFSGYVENILPLP